MSNKNTIPDNHENNRDNKGRFLPGKSPNPLGRPKKENVYSETLRELLAGQSINVEWTINGKKKKLRVTSTKNIYYGIASAQIMEALKGNVASQKEIVDRIQGRATQQIKISEVEDLDTRLRRAVSLMDEVDESNGINRPNSNTEAIS